MSESIETIMVEFFKDLDFLGPADAASTSRALASIALTPDAAVVDVGCGTGRQTLQLLQETSASVIATDLHQSMLDRLQQLAQEHGVSNRLRIERADMGALPFEPGSLDLIWCEGAIYNIGYEQGLRAWLPLLRPGGHLCVSEGVYLVDNPPAAVREFWEGDYPAITTQSRLEQLAKKCGYVLVDSFRLPRSAWEAYYAAVEHRIEDLETAWAEDPERQQVLAAMRHEIDVFRRHGGTYGYAFLVLKKPVE